MIHVDTHVVAWLHAGRTDLLSGRASTLINEEQVAISPMVELELARLHETGRTTAPAAAVLRELERTIGLRIDPTPFAEVAAVAAGPDLTFTPDPYDRLIAAQAIAAGVSLVTRNELFLERLSCAVWD